MPRRSPKGAGSIARQSDGTFLARISYQEDGKQKRMAARAESYQEAQEALVNLRQQLAAKQLSDPGALSLGTWLYRWLDTIVKPRRREATVDFYEILIRLHVEPFAVANLPLDQATPARLHAHLTELADKDRSLSLCEKVWVMLHAALQQAAKLDLLPVNPMSKVPRPKAEPKASVSLSAVEVGRFLEAAKADRFYALWALAVTLGLREGELLGLEWRHVDLEVGTLHVCQQLRELRGRMWIGPLKHAKQVRTLALPALAVVALQNLGPGTGFVFTDSEGGWVRKSNLHRRHFQPLRTAAQLPEATTIHSLRHTYASLLAEGGLSAKRLQSQLGHHSAAFTLDRYTHLAPDVDRHAAEAMDRIIGGLQPGRSRSRAPLRHLRIR